MTELLIGTFVLRPYVFGFVAAFVMAAVTDLGWRRTLLFAAWVAPLAWLAEFSSTRIGIPFGFYQYTGTTRGQELFIADVPMMDSLSFTFLTYAAFCLARAALGARRRPAAIVALTSGALMMLLDVVIDPVAVRGDRWFLGHIFFYPDGGVYFGVPLSNFVGWLILGALSIAGYVYGSDGRLGPSGGGSARGSNPESADLAGRCSATPDRTAGEGSGARAPSVTGRGADRFDRYGRRVWPGIALYYAVLVFNLLITCWIGEWLLLVVGVGVHVLTAAVLWNIGLRPAARLGLEKQRA